MSALRYIVNLEDKNVMLLIDDILPNYEWDFHRLNGLVEKCHRLDAKHNRTFRALQLRHGNNAALKMPDIPLYTSILRQGIYGLNENGYVMSTAGAQSFLDVYPDLFPDEDVLGMPKYFAERVYCEKCRSGFWTAFDEIILPNFRWRSDVWRKKS